MTNAPKTPSDDLPEAAKRALAEAEARRKQTQTEVMPKEYGGRDGPEPVRYGDWGKERHCCRFLKDSAAVQIRVSYPKGGYPKDRKSRDRRSMSRPRASNMAPISSRSTRVRLIPSISMSKTDPARQRP